MDFTHGILGLIGFLLFEGSWLISRKKTPEYNGQSITKDRRYVGTILSFGLLTFFAISIIGPSDLSAKMFPISFSNPTLWEASRSIMLGIACLLIYKSPSKFTNAAGSSENGAPRSETVQIGRPISTSFFEFVKHWARGF